MTTTDKQDMKRIRESMSKWDKQVHKLNTGNQINVTHNERRWLKVNGYNLEILQMTLKGYIVELKGE